MKILLMILAIILLFGCAGQQAIQGIKVQDQNINATANTETDVGQKNNVTETIDAKILTTGNAIEDKNNYTLTVYYFYTHYCNASNAIKPEIERLEAKYNDSVLFLRYNITEPAAFTEYNKFALKYNLSNKSRFVPLAYVNDRVLVGRFEINDSLELLIKKELEGE